MLAHCYHCQSVEIERGEVQRGLLGIEVPCRCRDCGTSWSEIQSWENEIQETLAL